MSGGPEGPVPIHPPGWARPSGYSNGVLTPANGRLLFVAGQIGWDEDQRLVGDCLVEQFEQALANVVAVVEAAGGRPEQICRLTIYVVDRGAYTATRESLGEAYQRVMGRHYPAMALLEVKGLLEPRALVEIEATAVLPNQSREAES